jgi:hypothetical protein
MLSGGFLKFKPCGLLPLHFMLKSIDKIICFGAANRIVNPPEIPVKTFNKPVCHCIGDGHFKFSLSIRDKGINI